MHTVKLAPLIFIKYIYKSNGKSNNLILLITPNIAFCTFSYRRFFALQNKPDCEKNYCLVIELISYLNRQTIVSKDTFWLSTTHKVSVKSKETSVWVTSRIENNCTT